MSASVTQLPRRPVCPHGDTCLHCAIESMSQRGQDVAASVPGPVLVSLAAAGELLSCSWDEVDRLAKAGEVDVVEGIGRGRKVTVESLHRLVSRHVGGARAAGG